MLVLFVHSPDVLGAATAKVAESSNDRVVDSFILNIANVVSNNNDEEARR